MCIVEPLQPLEALRHYTLVQEGGNDLIHFFSKFKSIITRDRIRCKLDSAVSIKHERKIENSYLPENIKVGLNFFRFCLIFQNFVPIFSYSFQILADVHPKNVI